MLMVYLPGDLSCPAERVSLTCFGPQSGYTLSRETQNSPHSSFRTAHLLRWLQQAAGNEGICPGWPIPFASGKK
jgi:hypothetical protein